ncbi:glutathione binding-like protein [Stenotrophomonas sp. PFBMAA-4]|uniref:glutathione S-transferase family protein n=1 Tax=Stenotrophomonas sp. PFBMAA-4 TaxID=3043301 RepID=UPI0024B5FA29|nr:glutathione binding-like protein [Stenotrophomonas sp. PFBMAA-4]MDI9271802.1 glutathione binding-like protein [Stenotrophomonas sp. PFBMAA-4]
MLTLHYWPGYCSLAAHIVLRWIGSPYRLKLADLDTRQSNAFLRLNPSSTVPVLVDEDGWALSQNVAVLRYLAEISPQARLGGEGVRGRALVNRWLAYINSDVHKAFSPLMHPERLAVDQDEREQTLDDARKVLRKHFGVFDKALGERPWIAGDHRSIADPYLFVLTRWARARGVDLGGFDGVNTHFARLCADPDVCEALAEEGLAGSEPAARMEH